MTEVDAFGRPAAESAADWLPEAPAVVALRRELEEAPQEAGPEVPPPEAPSQDGPPKPPPKGRPRGEIWEDCPVRPLGQLDGTSYYLDIHGQLRAITKHDAQAIMGLFGHRIPALCHHFPQWTQGRDGEPVRRKENRFDQTTAAMVMLQASAEKGLFDPAGAVRGVGAWVDDDGRLVYHCGDRLFIGGEEGPPRTHQGRIYPASPPIPHPAEPETGDPVTELLELLSTWQWARRDIDPMLTLGLIGCQMMGGALEWRPAYWFTGGPGTGKSALQRLMLHLHGGEKGLIQSTDPTARGIAALLGQSTLPVALDELEPGDAGSTKERDLVVTARVAASGGRWVRGSADQKGASGMLRSTFLFSSILVPGVLKSQDLQRLILISLTPFGPGSVAPPMRPEIWRKRGAQIKRLLIDRWTTWPMRLEAWREALAGEGIVGRDADNWATTLAMADMMRQAAMPSDDELTGWAGRVAGQVRTGLEEVGSDADEVLLHLLTSKYDPHRRGMQYTIAQWVQVAAGSQGAPPELLNDYQGDFDGHEKRKKAANAILAPAMLRVIEEAGQEPRLFVGNAKAGPLLDIFRDTQWAGGAWKQSLERVKGARLSEKSKTLAGVASRGVEVPLSAMPGLMYFPKDRSSEGDASKSLDTYRDDFA